MAAAIVGLIMVWLGKLANHERHSELDSVPEAPVRLRTEEERTQEWKTLASPELTRAEEEWLAELHVFAESSRETLEHFHKRTMKLLTDFLGEPYVIADSFESLHYMFDGTPTESFAKVEA
jgi:hypothetical protein